MDVLPAGVTFVPGTVTSDPALTSFTENAGTLTFDWTGQNIDEPVTVPAPGADSSGSVNVSSFWVEFQVTIDDGTIPQDLSNDAQLTYTNTFINDSAGTPGDTGPVIFTILDTAVLDTQKWVVADLDIPSTDPGDLDFEDGDNDRAFETRFPETGDVLPGGQIRYRVSLVNRGNQALDDIKVLEILPFIGDIGVVATNDARESEWSPFLITHSSQTDVFPDALLYDAAGAANGSTPVSVEWSTSTNPIRSDLDPALGDPTGGDANTFQSGSLPADLTTVKSLLLSFPSLTLEPLESVEFYFYLRAPDDAPPEAIAWNSIGRAANVAEDGSPIPSSEPLKVGIEANTVSIGNYVWIDSTLNTPATTGNGVQDASENPLPGATVTLFQYVDGTLVPAPLASGAANGMGGTVASVQTDANGNYLFEELIPSGTSYDGKNYGDFVVQVTPPSDQYEPSPTSTADPNGDSNTDNDGSLSAAPGGLSDPGGNTVWSGDVTVTVDGEPTDDGESVDSDLDDNNNMSVDFGFVADLDETASIGDFVWKDSDFNGEQTGEASNGVPGAVVSLLMEDPNNVGSFIPAVDAHGNPVADQTTDGTGSYSFEDLLPGDYQVVVDPPAGYAPSPSSGTADTNSDLPNDADGDWDNNTGLLTTDPVTLDAGENNTSVDFGLVEPLSIGNYVWVDDQPGTDPATDANGIQDAGEQPIVGALVELFVDNGSGLFVPVTTDVFGQPYDNTQFTDSSGNYLFENLPAGDYQVRVTPPGDAGYIPSPNEPDPNDDDNTDSNGVPVIGEAYVESGTIELRTDDEPTNDGDSSNDSNLSVDFGFSVDTVDVVGLGNYVWIDSNDDGIQDNSENPLAGAVVTLLMEDPTDPGVYIPAIDAFGNALPAVLSDSNGYYGFDDLRPDTQYTVRVTPPAFYVGSTPTAADTNADTVGDNDAKPVAGETYYESDPVLLTSNGEPTTDGGATGTDTDISLDDNNINQTIDFGFKPDPAATMNLGDYVWWDKNGNGRSSEAVDVPLPGATVELLMPDPANPSNFIPATDNDGNAIASQVTGPDGLYNFTDLLPGDYQVRVTPPAGYYPTPDDAGGNNNDLVDSDGDGYRADGSRNFEPPIADPLFAYSQTPTIKLEPGTAPTDDGDGSNGDLSVDFGFWSPVSLGDTVWFDNGADAGGTTAANVNDGILNGDEEGIEGVTVELYLRWQDPLTDTPFATTVTDANGNYLFEGLRPNNWKVYIPASEFGPGEPLEGLLSSTGNGTAPDPDNNVNNDDNGDPLQGTEVDNGVVSEGANLVVDGEPVDDGDSDNDSNLTLDFGFIEDADLVNLGDTVWIDIDNNGQLDGLEAGVDGVTVELFAAGVDPTDPNATPLRTTTTANGGIYEFDNLFPGDYFVYIPPSEFSGGPLDGFVSSNGNGTATDPDDNIDNDDDGEPYNGGTEISDGLTSGVITLALTEEPSDDDTAGDTNNTVDFGVYDPTTLVSLGDTVFLDNGGTTGVNNNGVLDGDEVGIADVDVWLFPAGADPLVDTPIRTTTTDGSGNYLFGDIPPGDYVVYIPQSELDAGGDLEELASSNGNGDYAPDPDDNADNDDNGTPLSGGGIVSSPITLTLGGEPTAGVDGDDADGNMTVDFGFTPKVSLGDTVFLDDGNTSGVSNSGTLDGDETGIVDVVVQLFPAGADPLTATPLAETVTDASGNYLFDNLAPGDYIVYIPESEFAGGEPLTGLASSNGNGIYAPDPDDDVQNDDNGTPDGLGGVASAPVTLTVDGETADDGFDSDNDNNSTVDFGFTPGVSLGDTVWLDADNSGDINGSEAGIAEVVVLLFEAGSDPTTATPIGVTTTDSSGLYQFDNLAPGDYFVHIPASEFLTGEPLADLASSNGNGDVAPNPEDNVQSDDNGNPDVASGGVSTGDITLTVGGETADDAEDGDSDNNSTVDLGFTPAVSLGDTVWADTDNSGDINGSEMGIDGVEVQLFPAGADVTDPAQMVAATVTDKDGVYQFSNLPPGDYIVYIPATEFEDGEPLEDLASSNGNGDFAPDPDDNVNDDDNGSPEDNGGVVSQPVTLTVGGESGDGDLDPNNNDSVDFGFTPGVSLGDTVWLDTDNSGAQEGGENGIADVVVELFAAGDNPLTATPILTDVTDVDGNYLFDNLPPGDYFVFIPDSPELTGLVSSTGNGQATDPDDDADSDDDGEPVAGGYQSGEITLTVGGEPTNDGDSDDSSNLSVDFGFTAPTDLVNLGDTVWFDEDNSGTQDNGESGIPGVVVELYDANDPDHDEPGVDPPFFTTTTGSAGDYSFENLNPGDYIVYLPASNFDPDAALDNLDSSDGNGLAPDPDNDVDADDNGEPDNQGGIVSGPITLTTGGEPGGTNTNSTVDFGLKTAKPSTYVEWQEFFADGLGDSDGPADNADGDAFPNAIEYAFCTDPTSGLASPGQFCLSKAPDGTVSVQFFRRKGSFDDVTYTLEGADTLGTPTSWNTLSGFTETIDTTDPLLPDGAEKVTYSGVQGATGLSGPDNGVVRMAVEVDGTTYYSDMFGWQCVGYNDYECATFSTPFSEKPVLSGTFGTGTLTLATDVDGNVTLDVSGATSTDLSPIVGSNGAYYLQITSGTLEGHRFDILSGGAGGLTLVSDDDIFEETIETLNTMDGIPADGLLNGQTYEVIRYHTVDDLFDKTTTFAGEEDTDPNDYTRLLFYNSRTSSPGFEVLGLNGTSTADSKWIYTNDLVSQTDRGDLRIDPCGGNWVHPKSSGTPGNPSSTPIEVLAFGLIADHDQACALNEGFNLTGAMWPFDQTPAGVNGRDLTVGAQFDGGIDPNVATELLFWQGDTVVDDPLVIDYSEGYANYMLLDGGGMQNWIDINDIALQNQDTLLLLESHRAVFLSIQPNDEKAAHIYPLPAF
jgi:protocatechuate 3,4-dioxygenase beta subunit